MKNITLVNGYVENRKYSLFLIFLVLSGFILRFYHLGFDSLWLDEAATHSYAKESFLGILQSTLMGTEFHPPVFYWLEHIMLYCGDNEVVLRFIPAIVGVLTIPIFYLIGVEYIDRNTGLLSATLLTFSPFNIYYSQEARSYTLFMLLFSISLLFYLKTLKSTNVRNWILFGIFSSLTLWIHYYALIPIGLLYFHSLIINSRKIKENIKSVSYIGISFFTFILLSFPLIIKVISLFLVKTSSTPTWGMEGTKIISQTFIQFSNYNKIVCIIFLLLFIAGIAFNITTNINKSLLLIYLMFFSLLISYILSPKMSMEPRYLIYLFPIFSLGIASSYNAFNLKMNNKSIIYLLIILIIMTSVPYLSHYYSGFHKNDWRGFSKNIQQMTHENDVVVVLPKYMAKPLNYYYDNKSDQTYEYKTSNSVQLQEIYSHNKGHQIYYVVGIDHLNAANPEGDAAQWLKNNTKLLKKYRGIYLYSSK